MICWALLSLWRGFLQLGTVRRCRGGGLALAGFSLEFVDSVWRSLSMICGALLSMIQA